MCEPTLSALERYDSHAAPAYSSLRRETSTENRAGINRYAAGGAAQSAPWNPWKMTLRRGALRCSLVRLLLSVLKRSLSLLLQSHLFP